MRVGDHRSRAAGHDERGIFLWREHGTFDMDVAVDKSRKDCKPRHIVFLLPFVTAYADYSVAAYGDVARLNFARKGIDEARIF